MRSRSTGVALVAALLTLTSLSTLALATILLLSFDLELAENRQEQAMARAQAMSRLTLALLSLERAASEGEFPEAAPAAEGIVLYRRLDATSAVVVVEGSEGSSRHRSGARVELRSLRGDWRLHIVERR